MPMRFVLTLGVVLGCGSDAPPDGNLVEQLFASDDAVATPTCDCFAEEYSSYDECFFAEAFMDSRSCVESTFAASPDALEDTVQCILGVNDAFLDCIRGVGCDVDAWAACYEEGNGLLAPCQVNPAAQAETDALFGCFPGDF